MTKTGHCSLKKQHVQDHCHHLPQMLKAQTDLFLDIGNGNIHGGRDLLVRVALQTDHTENTPSLFGEQAKEKV